MNDTKNRFKFTNEIILKLTPQKNKFLIIHFNFIWEIPLKMKDIKKIIHFNLTKEISLKMNRPTKSKNWEFSQKGLSGLVKF